MAPFGHSAWPRGDVGGDFLRPSRQSDGAARRQHDGTATGFGGRPQWHTRRRRAQRSWALRQLKARAAAPSRLSDGAPPGLALLDTSSHDVVNLHINYRKDTVNVNAHGNEEADAGKYGGSPMLFSTFGFRKFPYVKKVSKNLTIRTAGFTKRSTYAAAYKKLNNKVTASNSEDIQGKRYEAYGRVGKSEMGLGYYGTPLEVRHTRNEGLQTEEVMIYERQGSATRRFVDFVHDYIEQCLYEGMEGVNDMTVPGIVASIAGHVEKQLYTMQEWEVMQVDEDGYITDII